MHQLHYKGNVLADPLKVFRVTILNTTAL